MEIQCYCAQEHIKDVLLCAPVVQEILLLACLQLKCLPLGKILDSSLQRSGTIDGIGEALGDKVIAF